MEFTIDELFIELFKKGIITQVKACTVTSVDSTNDVCVLSPTDDSPDLNNVRLTATIDSKDSKIVVYPKQGSIVLAGRINNIKTQCFVCAYSEIDSVKILIGDKSFTIDTNGITMNNGSFGGIVKKDAVEVIVQFLTAIKNSFDSWVPAPNDGGAALKGLIQPALDAITLPANTDIENTNVKHG